MSLPIKFLFLEHQKYSFKSPVKPGKRKSYGKRYFINYGCHNNGPNSPKLLGIRRSLANEAKFILESKEPYYISRNSLNKYQGTPKAQSPISVMHEKLKAINYQDPRKIQLRHKSHNYFNKRSKNRKEQEDEDFISSVHIHHYIN